MTVFELLIFSHFNPQDTALDDRTPSFLFGCFFFPPKREKRDNIHAALSLIAARTRLGAVGT